MRSSGERGVGQGMAGFNETPNRVDLPKNVSNLGHHKFRKLKNFSEAVLHQQSEKRRNGGVEAFVVGADNFRSKRKTPHAGSGDPLKIVLPNALDMGQCAFQ